MLVGLLFLYLPAVFAQGRIEVQLETSFVSVTSGEEIEVEMLLKNISGKDELLGVRFHRITGSNGYGQLQTDVPKTENKWDIAHWFIQELSEITLASFAEQRKNFVLRVPEDTPPGVYMAAILLYRLEQRAQSIVTLPLVVLVDTEVVSNAVVRQFDIDMDALREGDPIRIRLRIENTGTELLRPTGNVRAYQNGELVTELGTLYQEDGEQTFISYLEVNPSGEAILPGHSRTFVLIWNNPRLEGDIRLVYELFLGTEGSEVQQGETSLILKKNLQISSFVYNTEESKFSVTLQNKGNIPMPVQGLIHLYDHVSEEPLDTLVMSDKIKEYVEVGKSKVLEFSWKSYDQTLLNTVSAVFSYVLDPSSGETLSRKIFLKDQVRTKESMTFILYIILGLLIVLVVLIINKTYQKFFRKS